MSRPDAGLDELTRVAAILGVVITPRASDERFTAEADEWLRRALRASLRAMIAADPVPLAILERFTEVVVLDSSTVRPPQALRSRFAGCAAPPIPGRATRR